MGAGNELELADQCDGIAGEIANNLAYLRQMPERLAVVDHLISTAAAIRSLVARVERLEQGARQLTADQERVVEEQNHYIRSLEDERRSLVAERESWRILADRVNAERDALRAERDRLQDRCNTYVVNMAEQGNEIERIRAERDALREMLLAAQYDIDTIDPEMAQKLCDFYAAPPEEGRLDCGDDCEMCSGEYCTKHPHEACDCDVIDRHRPEEG